MIVMAIQHQVRDYEAWKSVFDTFPPTAEGALFHRVNRGLDDPNTVVVVCGWTSTEQAEAFRSDPRLVEKMREAGVVGAPRIETYREVEAVQV